MSSDFYNYTGNTPEGNPVEVTCCGYNEKPEEPRLETVCSINGIDLNDEVDEKILEMVRGGKISLTYTGGWCSNGSFWDAEGDDLEELHQIREAFSLIQSVSPDMLCKALKLS